MLQHPQRREGTPACLVASLAVDQPGGERAGSLDVGPQHGVLHGRGQPRRGIRRLDRHLRRTLQRCGGRGVPEPSAVVVRRRLERGGELGVRHGGGVRTVPQPGSDVRRGPGERGVRGAALGRRRVSPCRRAEQRVAEADHPRLAHQHPPPLGVIERRVGVVVRRHCGDHGTARPVAAGRGDQHGATRRRVQRGDQRSVDRHQALAADERFGQGGDAAPLGDRQPLDDLQQAQRVAMGAAHELVEDSRRQADGQQCGGVVAGQPGEQRSGRGRRATSRAGCRRGW